MLLKELIKGLEVKETIGNLDTDIKQLSCDSNCVGEDCLFICLKGKNFDGHNFINKVEKYGGKCVIVEKKVDTYLTQIVVEDCRKAISIVASNFYHHPNKKLKLVGVTGTNGKTTITYILKNILEESGMKCGVIGTLGTTYNGKHMDSNLTTPDPLELHKLLYDMCAEGIKVVIMEVSAHAIYFKKIYGLTFDIGIFTNLTQDHLDFFETMENYGNVKKSFFENNCKLSVVNIDDKTGQEIKKKNKEALTYGIYNPADAFVINIKYSDSGTSYVVNLFDYIGEINSNLLGEFNIYNCLASGVAAGLLGVKMDKIIEGLNIFSFVSGRLELVYDGNYKIYIDYAHTPDGLEKSLSTLKKICKNRLISVFGCGGNRDKGKRKIMGKVSGEIADFSVITTDNPRYEDPMEIIFEIEQGLMSVSKEYVIVENRKDAIKYAINFAKVGDIILIAGKGSENYQEILGTKHFYNDKEVIKELIREKEQ